MRGGTSWQRAIALVALILLASPRVAAQDNQLELAVEAAYLSKLAPFVVWPNDAAEFPGGVFPICVIGHDPFGSLLDRAVSGQTVAGHPVVIRRFDATNAKSPCALAYLGGVSLAALAEVQGQPVLTITDRAADPGMKGIINFVIQDNRVRFEIDDVMASRAGLGISSKLLSLAVTVRSRAP